MESLEHAVSIKVLVSDFCSALPMNSSCCPVQPQCGRPPEAGPSGSKSPLTKAFSSPVLSSLLVLRR